MSEHAVFFKAGSITLEGRYSHVSPTAPGAVICHPHPAYGGTMDNNVVDAAVQALQQTGHSTLRFNFRGVGRSEGRYGEGLAEVEDVRAAIRFLLEQAPESEPIVLAGYSFGSWVASHSLQGDAIVSHLILIAPPTSMFDFSSLLEDKEERARHVIVGERDQFCDRDELQRIYKQLPEPKSLQVVPRTDHFFYAHEKYLIEAIKDAVADHHATGK